MKQKLAQVLPAASALWLSIIFTLYLAPLLAVQVILSDLTFVERAVGKLKRIFS